MAASLVAIKDLLTIMTAEMGIITGLMLGRTLGKLFGQGKR